MHRTTKIGASAAIAAVALIASAAAANASVTIDADGKGFIGKGNVQTALGYNNSALQKAVDAKSLTFTMKQPTSQSLSSTATQTGSQVGTQSATQVSTQVSTQTATESVTETLSCIKTTGQPAQQSRHGVATGTRTDTREATRTDTREATRNVERVIVKTGNRAGVNTGALTWALDVEARKGQSQYTGFIAKGWAAGSPVHTDGVVSWGTPSLGDWSGEWNFDGGWDFGTYDFGAYDFGAYEFGATTWGAWDTDGTNAEPDVCLNNGNIVEGSLVHTFSTPVLSEGSVVDDPIEDGVIHEDDVVEGAIHEGPIAFGDTQYGDVLPDGPATLFVNGKPIV
jgi:hypothetical protein